MFEYKLGVDIVRELKKAVRYFSSGQLEAAKDIFYMILKFHPQHPDALHLLGVIAHQTGNNKKAVDLITRAIRIDPRQAIYYNNLGNALKDIGELDKAVSCYQKALTIDPSYEEALYNLGNTFQEQGTLELAIACYRRALMINPKSAHVYDNLGVSLKEKGNTDEAIQCFLNAIDVMPDFIDAYNNMTAALEGINRLDDAYKAVGTALRINPDSHFANLNLAQLEYRNGNYFNALNLLETLVSNEPPVAFLSKTYFLLGMASDKLGNFDVAFKAFCESNRQELALTKTSLYPQKNTEDLENIRKMRVWFSPEIVCEWKDENPDDGLATPVFLVGFPRSGTTLLERILDTHSAVITLD